MPQVVEEITQAQFTEYCKNFKQLSNPLELREADAKYFKVYDSEGVALHTKGYAFNDTFHIDPHLIDSQRFQKIGDRVSDVATKNNTLRLLELARNELRAAFNSNDPDDPYKNLLSMELLEEYYEMFRVKIESLDFTGR